MDNRYEIAEQNGMSREFADWFFDNKKAGCGNVWLMMMAAMWEGWQGCAAMLQGAENGESATTMKTVPALDSSPKIDESPSGNSPVIPDGWVACSERMPNIGVPVITCCGDVVQYAAYAWDGKAWQDWYEEYDKLTPLPTGTLGQQHQWFEKYHMLYS